MIEKKDKKRLFLLVDRYLENQIMAWVFCIKYQEFYQLVFNACILPQEEQLMFSLLHSATTKYSEDEDEIGQHPAGFFYTKQEFRQEIVAIKQKFIDCWQEIPMDFAKLVLDTNYGGYSYKDSSTIAMDIVSGFLSSDVDCRVDTVSFSALQEWALDDDLGDVMSSNTIKYEKDGPYIHLQDALQDKDEVAITVTILRSQFVQLVDEWQEKVCKKTPKEVIIIHESGEFWIETKD